MKTKIAPSILAADFSKLDEELKAVETADLLHIDVMDGNFVPINTLDKMNVRKMNSKVPFDVHLMVNNPMKFLDDFTTDNTEYIVFHIEGCDDPDDVIEEIKRRGIKPGITLKPATPLEDIKPYLSKVDMVLIMSVNPGYSGQKFIPDVLGKIKELRKLKPNLDIEIDGGINNETAKLAVKAGANVLVAASFIFKNNNHKKAIEELRNV